MDVVAIDPAASRYAYAIFHDGELIQCGYEYKAAALSRVIDPNRVYVWVLEVPRNYGRFAVAHKDLDRLRRVLKKIKSNAVRPQDKVVHFAPSAWKGNVPKKIHHKRLWEILTEQEKRRLPDQPGTLDYAHDIHDAVALGATYLERMGRGGKKRRTTHAKRLDS